MERGEILRGATICSGIGAPETAAPTVEWLWSAEVEPFPSAVLAARHPHSVNLGDITAADFIARAQEFGALDLLVAGTPCQAFSVAGLRKSLDDARGNLTLRFVEIVHAINPGTVLWENVPGVLSTKDNAFGCFLGSMVGADATLEPVPYSNRSKWWRSSRRPKRWRMREDRGWDVIRWRERFWPVWPDAGMVIGPRRACAWRILDAQYVGLAQRRRRVFVLSRRTGDGSNPGEILFEPQSVRRDSPPSRAPREDITGTIAARTRGGGGLGTDFDLGGGFNRPSVDR